jgi:hypothetical protein
MITRRKPDRDREPRLLRQLRKSSYGLGSTPNPHVIDRGSQDLKVGDALF